MKVEKKEKERRENKKQTFCELFDKEKKIDLRMMREHSSKQQNEERTEKKVFN